MIQHDYGYLAENQREYVITNPRTPRPWFNYMWNSRYGGLVSHTGGGFSFLESPRDNRISRMRYNCLPWDRPGRYVMLRDTENGEYWSLSWAPTIDRAYDTYEARHGLGYTRIKTEYQGILGEICYFVPRGIDAEIWKVRLENRSAHTRKLQVYAFQELMMGNALNDIINQPNDKHFTDISFNRETSCLEATRRYWVLNRKSASVEQPNLSWAHKVYFGMNLPISGFDSSLDAFIGRWRSEANPMAVESGKMGNTEITAGDPVVALQSEVQIQAGESLEFAVVMGIASKETKDPYGELNWEALQQNQGVDLAFEELKKWWDYYLSHVQVKSPDSVFNSMINVWNQYQSAVTFDMARNSGYYHGGLLFGTGMRDQFQDILGVVIVDPQRVRQRILNALQYQFSDGSSLHNFFALTGHGERTHHSDTPLWIPFGIVEYLNESGDMSILDEEVVFHDQGKASVYEHLVRALDFAIGDTGERGFPLIRKGDWNDTLDHIGPRGKGETVWGAFFLCYIINKSLPLIRRQGDTAVQTRWEEARERIARKLNEIAWDGQWYVRAFRDNGESVGDASRKQGKIFLNAQSWSVISGVATPERADTALSSCLRHLENPTGMQICWPAFREVEDDIGLISRCVPGKKENGAVFNHASAWFVLAALMNGQTEDAWRIYSKMMPLNSSMQAGIDRFETEPWVYPEYVTSREHPTEGQASHSWLTGSSVWMYRIALDGLLGMQTSLEGISIKPRLPSHWPSVEISRQFRGKRLLINISRQDKHQGKAPEMRINGKIHEQSLIDVSRFSEDVLNIQVII